LRPDRGAAGRGGDLSRLRRRDQAVPDEVAGRVVLQPRGGRPHPPRPQGGGRRGDPRLHRSRLRRGPPVTSGASPPWTGGPPLLLVASLTLRERKFAARLQSRVGPYEVGRPHGWLQPIADGLKLLLKEDIVPALADRAVYNLAPIVFLVPAFLMYAAMPFAPR